MGSVHGQSSLCACSIKCFVTFVVSCSCGLAQTDVHAHRQPDQLPGYCRIAEVCRHRRHWCCAAVTAAAESTSRHALFYSSKLYWEIITSNTCAVRLRGLRHPSPCILTALMRPASSDNMSHDIDVLTARHSFSRARSARQVTFSNRSAVCKAGRQVSIGQQSIRKSTAPVSLHGHHTDVGCLPNPCARYLQ
eukprot:GHRQ01026834.1.p1 GENE.GHRQ01026834.1~~GHRQ01026834.1.p1  ORF type:complete len:192 (+),score=4.99 GHRQ01026834.1:378-953(+)